MRLRRTLVATLSIFALFLGMATLAGPTSVAAQPPTALISAPDGNLYFVYDGTRHGADSPTLAALGVVETRAIAVTQATLEGIRDGARLPALQNGAIIAGPDGERYLLFDGLHAIPDDATFDAQGWGGYAGFESTPVVLVDAALLAALPRGAPLDGAARGGPNRFDWGYCTWWVAQRREVSWMGNAIEWYPNAQAEGYAVGDVPVPGAILVRRSAAWGGYGHVAYVESVAGTTFTVSEMNVAGLGRLSTRTYDLATDPPGGLVGFIYWRYGTPVAPLGDGALPDETAPGIAPGTP